LPTSASNVIFVETLRNEFGQAHVGTRGGRLHTTRDKR